MGQNLDSVINPMLNFPLGGASWDLGEKCWCMTRCLGNDKHDITWEEIDKDLDVLMIRNL